ncbi:MAG: cellulase family glycosylhydrolase [Victivallales bacterium]|nr:cellulase family glycosylhydrolase [Victivallales bacterium]
MKNNTLHKGMGIGGWLTNYKRLKLLPPERRMILTIGDFEHFDTYISRDDIQYIASLGLDHIRLGFDQLVLEEAPGIYRERIFALLHNFVDWCHEAGVTPVLNLHKAIGNYCDLPIEENLLDSLELQERFVDLWSTIEREFHNDPKPMFELLNELKGNPSQQWNALARRTYNAIRATNPTRPIIIGSTKSNDCTTLCQLEEYDDPNLIYTWHFYWPFEFTHQQGVLQPSPLFYNRKMAYPSDIAPYRDYQKVVRNELNAYSEYDRMDIRWMRDATRPAFEFQEKHPNNTVWCGEFGTIRHCKLEYRENWLRDLISLLREHHTPYCVWNYLSTPNDGNRFSLVDDDSRKILSPRLAAIIQGKA